MRIRNFPLSLTIPALAFLTILTVYPILYSLYISFQEWNLRKPDIFRLIWLDNYGKILYDPIFHIATLNTLTFMLVLPVEIFCGLMLAMLLNSEIRFRGLYRLGFIMPIFLAPVVTAVMWKLMFLEEFGVANYFLLLAGFQPINWLGTSENALASIAISWVWRFIGFNAVMLEAGLASLPVEPFDSAKIDGASSLQILRHVTIPLLKPVFVVVILMRSMVIFKMFQLVYVMTGGGPGESTEVLGLYIYKTAFVFTDMGYAAALSWVMLGITGVLSIMYVTALRRRQK